MSEAAFTQCAIFVDLTPDELDLVTGTAQRYSVPVNHLFFDMEVSNESLFVVLSGAVCVERPGTEANIELATLGAGAIFGEMSFIDGSKTTAQVRTTQPTEVLEFKSGDFHRIVADRPELASKLWHNLALEFKQRLAHTNELVDYYADLSQVLRDNPGAAALLGT